MHRERRGPWRRQEEEGEEGQCENSIKISEFGVGPAAAMAAAEEEAV